MPKTPMPTTRRRAMMDPRSRRAKKSIVILLPLFLIPCLASSQDLLTTEDLLAMPLNALMNVKVSTVTKVPERIADLPASIVVLTREEIQAMGYISLSKILRTIPGFYAIDDYNYNDNFGVRGFWSDAPNRHMTILINGTRRAGGFFDDNDMRYLAIPPEAIDHIEIVRGPNSLIYGSGSFFGVINIVTTPQEPNNQSRVHATWGSRSTRRLVATTSQSKDDWSLNAHAAYTATDGLDIPYANMGALEEYSTRGHLNRRDLNFNLHGALGPLSCQVYFAENRDDNVFLFPSVGDGTQCDNPLTSVSMTYEKPLGSVWSARTSFSYTRVSDGYDYHVLAPDFWGVQRINSAGWRWDADFGYRPQSGLLLSFGLDGQTLLDVVNNYDLPGFGAAALEHIYESLHPCDDIRSQASYIRLNARLSPSFQLTMGLRLERQLPYRLVSRQATLLDSTYAVVKETRQFENTHWDAVPQLACVIQPNSAWAIKLLYGKAIKHPSAIQNLGQDRSPDASSLRSEWIETFELSLLFEPHAPLILSASLFYNRLNDLILRSTGFNQSGEFYDFYDNIGRMRTLGGELQLTVKPHHGLKLEFSAASQSLKNRDKALDPVGYIPQWLLYGKCQWQPSRHINLGLFLNYTGEMDAGWDASTEGRIGRRAPAHAQLGVNLRYAPPFATRWYGQIHLSNALNQKIVYPTTTNSRWAPLGTRGEPRTALLTLGLKL